MNHCLAAGSLVVKVAVSCTSGRSHKQPIINGREVSQVYIYIYLTCVAIYVWYINHMYTIRVVLKSGVAPPNHIPMACYLSLRERQLVTDAK